MTAKKHLNDRHWNPQERYFLSLMGYIIYIEGRAALGIFSQLDMAGDLLPQHQPVEIIVQDYVDFLAEFIFGVICKTCYVS